MNDIQAATIRRITNRITDFARYTNQDLAHSDSNGWYNGPVVFRTEPIGDESVMLIASNNTKEKRWFEKDYFGIALIGPRGGIRVKREDIQGFGKHAFK